MYKKFVRWEEKTEKKNIEKSEWNLIDGIFGALSSRNLISEI